MLPPDPSHVAHRYVPGAGALQIRRLRGGVVNRTYRVLRDGRAYALRLSERATRWATDPEWECRVLALAADAGLAPPVHHCDPGAGVLVSAWVEGRAFMPGGAADGIARMAALMRRVHSLRPPQPPRAVAPAGWVAHYDTLLEGMTGSDDAAAGEMRRLRAAAALRLRALSGLPAVSSVLCHGDLHPLNLLETDHGLVVLDWEYSHVTHPYWDLAAWSSANDWGAQPRWELLRAYAGDDLTPVECLRFDLFAWLYDYICLAWSALYAMGVADGGLDGADNAGAAAAGEAGWGDRISADPLTDPGGSSDAGAAALVAARAQQLAARLHEYPVVAAAQFRHTT